MQPEDTENKKVTKTAKRTEEYHFAGEGKYAPHTVTAENQEQAQEIWEKERKEV